MRMLPTAVNSGVRKNSDNKERKRFDTRPAKPDARRGREKIPDRPAAAFAPVAGYITFVPLIGTGEDNGQAQIVLLFEVQDRA